MPKVLQLYLLLKEAWHPQLFSSKEQLLPATALPALAAHATAFAVAASHASAVAAAILHTSTVVAAALQASATDAAALHTSAIAAAALHASAIAANTLLAQCDHPSAMAAARSGALIALWRLVHSTRFY